MASSLRLFKIFGISVELHWTFLLFLVYFLLVKIQFFYSLLLVFLIVLIHELCHSLTALRYKIKVPRITLTPIGGMANLEIPEDPKKEFIISLAGPMSNFVMLFLTALVAVLMNIPLTEFTSNIGISDIRLNDATGILVNIFWINFMLGAFNILPGFPMDGGRVFRAVLAMFKKDYIEATEIAVNVGKIVSVLFIFLGILGGFDLSLIVIGLFLMFAGGQELEVLRVRHYLRGLSVGKIASPTPRYAVDSLSLKDFMTTIATPEQIHYPVIDSEHRITGVLNLSDLRTVSEADYPVATVKDLARRDISVVGAGMNVESNLQFLLSKEYFFVEDEGRVVGYLTPNIVLEAARFYGITKKE
jgi:Zn-dependent protease